MPTEEHYKKLIRQLQEELHRLDCELLRQGEKLQEKIDILKQSIPKADHEKRMGELRREYEQKLLEIILISNKHIDKV